MPREAEHVEPGYEHRALALVNGERQAAYGEPVAHWTKVAARWSDILDSPVTAKRAALCMAAMKEVREEHRHDPDNAIDFAGYMEIARRCGEAGAC